MIRAVKIDMQQKQVLNNTSIYYRRSLPYFFVDGDNDRLTEVTHIQISTNSGTNVIILFVSKAQ